MTKNRTYRSKYAGRRRSRIWDVILTLIFFAVLAGAILWLDRQNAEEISGRFYVADGDTLILQQQRLRLMGIDAPEFDQKCTRDGRDWNCGRASRNALKVLVGKGGIVCKSSSKDQYERPLVRCARGELDVNAEMVRTGWAVDYGGYAREEAQARLGQSGIWAGQFENPQEWRRAHKGDASQPLPQNQIERLKLWWVQLGSSKK